MLLLNDAGLCTQDFKLKVGGKESETASWNWNRRDMTTKQNEENAAYSRNVLFLLFTLFHVKNKHQAGAEYKHLV